MDDRCPIPIMRASRFLFSACTTLLRGFGTDLLGSCLVLSPITLRSIVTPI